MSSPAKRQRTAEDAPMTRENAITRSDIWFDDGSVVLHAGNTQFRVHWAVLAHHSSFFREMRGLPQPPDQPSVEGCPVLEFSDDPMDVEFVMKALYTPTFLSQTVLPLPVVGALVRLGRKYEFRDLFDSAVARLTFENPTTLEEYDSLSVDCPYHTATRIVPYDALKIDIIGLARENNLVCVLPAAYYHLVLYGVDTLLDGILREDGTLASLAPVDLHRCLRGRERLMHVQANREYARGWFHFWKPGDDCSNSRQCTKTRDARLGDYLNSPNLKALGIFAPTSDRNKRFCAACKQGVKEWNAAGRKRTWNELPSFFDLPPWSELKNDP